MSEAAGASPPKDQDIFGNELRLTSEWGFVELVCLSEWGCVGGGGGGDVGCITSETRTAAMLSCSRSLYNQLLAVDVVHAQRTRHYVFTVTIDSVAWGGGGGGIILGRSEL